MVLLICSKIFLREDQSFQNTYQQANIYLLLEIKIKDTLFIRVHKYFIGL